LHIWKYKETINVASYYKYYTGNAMLYRGSTTLDRKRIYANPSAYPNPNSNSNPNTNLNPNPNPNLTLTLALTLKRNYVFRLTK